MLGVAVITVLLETAQKPRCARSHSEKIPEELFLLTLLLLPSDPLPAQK